MGSRQVESRRAEKTRRTRGAGGGARRQTGHALPAGAPPAAEQRLQKVLARAGIASRRHAEELILAGRVSVDGKIVRVLGTRVDPGRAAIEVDGLEVAAEPLTYVLFHKPRGVVSTMRDPAGRPAVADYLREVGARVVPVGRLDYQTSGVLLLTNDGALARRLLHPSQGVLKEYLLKVHGKVDEAGLARFHQSIAIDGQPTRPATVEVERVDGDKTWLTVVLHEGKNRQVRRLAEHAGYRVMRLSRSHFAGLGLEGLAPGAWRHLTPPELGALGVDG
jgi:23S rRNA pseudouridine2605 synthase